MKIEKQNRKTKFGLLKHLLLKSKVYLGTFDSTGDSISTQINYSDFKGIRSNILINRIERVEFFLKISLKIIHFYHFNRMNIVFIGIPLWYKKQFDLFLKNKSNCSSIFNNTNELLKINRKNFVRQVNVNRSAY